SECRQALDAMNKVVRGHFNKEKEGNNIFESKWDRLAGHGKEALYGFLSVFMHQEDAKTGSGKSSISPTYWDAENAIFFTKIMLKHAHDLLRSQNKDGKGGKNEQEKAT
ncbi:MAG: hypothetical protein QXU18_10270, partial [Thermoplasmatales archaeon]